MPARDSDFLATLAKLGLDTPAQREQLALDTLAVCKIVAQAAVRKRHLRIDDLQDVVQEAAIRALGRLDKWNPAKSAWRTYAGVVAKSAVGQMRRQYQKDSRLVPLPDNLDDCTEIL